ncbi:response regulator [Nodosilinea nodulosa]|uniref:response regulator n=1 Tax=Nodosilinea nodulosa TaxID=416001 RepID=UPI0003670631|nr:response regulator [Nodosilinea nodulosa]
MSTPRTVLVIADTQEQANPYRQQLQQDGSVAYSILLEQYSGAASLLSQTPLVDGILLGLSRPQENSMALLQQLKQQMGDRCPPIVIVGGGNTRTAVQAIKQGAADYLVQDQTTPDDLRLAMRSAIENAELRQPCVTVRRSFKPPSRICSTASAFFQPCAMRRVRSLTFALII